MTATLTEREREVAIAVGEGKVNAEIAAELFLSVATIKAHVSRLMTKLEATDRVQLAVRVRDAGLLLALPPSGRAQSTGSPPCSTSIALTRENGREPKKPRLADSGDGCTDSTYGTWPSIGLSDWASRPHRIATQRPAALHQRRDGALGDLLPAFAAVRGGLAGPHGEHPVEQHHARSAQAVRSPCRGGTTPTSARSSA